MDAQTPSGNSGVKEKKKMFLDQIHTAGSFGSHVVHYCPSGSDSKIWGLFTFIPGHEHVAHISAIVMVSHGLSGNLGADRTLFSSLISCLWRNPVRLVGPVARLWNNTVFHQAHWFFFLYISFIKSFGAFWRGVWVFSYPYTPTWQHHKHPLWEDSWGDRAENTENKSH